MSFTKEEEIKLIELVVKYRCLYDPTDQDYKDLNLRNTYWKEIASHFKENSYNECKKRWRTIRDTYKRLRKKGKLGSGNSKREWHLAPYLIFLEYVADDPRTNISTNDNCYENTDEESNCVETKLTVNTDLDNGSIGTYSPTSSNNSQKSQSVKRKWNEEFQALLDKNQIEKQQLIEVISYLGNKHEDEVDVFYKSIAMSVKQLPPHLIAEAKTEHLQTLHRLQLQSLDQEPSQEEIPQQSNQKRNRNRIRQIKVKNNKI